jgi:hypothetical protein
MATRPRLVHDVKGDPVLLARAPEPALLERAGAGKMAKTLRRALSLRDDCRKARAELQQAERALKTAEARDREEHARAIAKSRNAALEPKHAEEAERRLAEARRRVEALVLAVEDAATAYFNAGEEEAETAAEAAREQRERSAAEIRRAHETVVAAIDAYEDLATAANATADPTSKRPRPALRSAEVARVRNDKGLAWLDALGAWIEEQQLAAEVEAAPKVYFGWHGGTQAS